MIFEHLSVSNFRCYESADVGFDEGVTVVQGRNGSGKTSLLKACFTALYGSNALGADEVLADVVTNGEEETRLELDFRHGGDSYTTTQEIALSSDGRATTRSSVLERNGEAIGDDGIRSTRDEVRRLLRMDAEAFVNCAYVRQGEVNKLINASPDERQRVIDDLLQLGKLERYRERASLARRGVGRVRTRVDDRLNEKRDEVEKLEDAGLHERLSSLSEKKKKLDAAADESEEKLRKAESRHDEVAEKLDTYEEKKEKLDEVETEIRSLEDEIKSKKKEKKEYTTKAREKRQRADELEDEIRERLPDGYESVEGFAESAAEDEKDLSNAVTRAEGELKELSSRKESMEKRLEDRRESLKEANRRAEEIRSRLNDRREKAEKHRSRAEELNDELDSLGTPSRGLDELRDEMESKKESLAELRAERKEARRSLEESEELIEEGVCPNCGQEVDDDCVGTDEYRERIDELDAEIDALEDEVERLEPRIEAAEREKELAKELEHERELLENVTEGIEEAEEKLEKATKKSEEAAEGSAEINDEIESLEADIDEAEDELEEKEKELEDAEEKLEEARELREMQDEADELRDEADTLVERAESNEEVVETKKQQLKDKRGIRDETEDELGGTDVEELREERKKAARAVKKFEERIDGIQERKDSVSKKIGNVESKIDRLESLREDIEETEEKLEAVESLYDEAEELEETYRSLRAELRRRNVRRLDQLLNEIFSMVYSDDSYSRIELSHDYELTVYEKDGTPLEPKQLSGGERAVFNLSLRCAVYRLLVEGISGDSAGGNASLPPLILDEPTVFLDSEHVSRLIDLIRTMNDDFGVEQIIVVSHDEELLDAADSRLTVEKDPTTNRSRVVEEPRVTTY